MNLDSRSDRLGQTAYNFAKQSKKHKIEFRRPANAWYMSAEGPISD